jgi:hypothetical protein
MKVPLVEVGGQGAGRELLGGGALEGALVQAEAAEVGGEVERPAGGEELQRLAQQPRVVALDVEAARALGGGSRSPRPDWMAQARSRTPST